MSQNSHWRKRLLNLIRLAEEHPDNPEVYYQEHDEAYDLSRTWRTCAVGEAHPAAVLKGELPGDTCTLGMDFETCIENRDYKAALELHDRIWDLKAKDEAEAKAAAADGTAPNDAIGPLPPTRAKAAAAAKS